MSGKWTRIYEDGKWKDVYVEDWPQPLAVGTAGTLPPGKGTTLYGPDGKPLRDVIAPSPKRRPFGFDPEDAR